MNPLDRLTELTRPTGEEDALDVSSPPPRLKVAPKQAFALVALVLTAIGCWALLRPAPPEVTPAWETTTLAPPPPPELVVSVVGEVEHPGLVTLAPGARVADALAAARPRPDVDLLSLNQAQPLADGQQILVGGPTPEPGTEPTPEAGKISLNSASATELTTLPGVGEATAAAIVSHREKSGPFRSVDALLEVKGIGPAKFAAIKDLVTV